MKPTKAAIKSSKIIIKKIQATANLYPNKVLDTTVIPIGSTDAFVELPSLKDTYTYNIINTNEMTGNITLRTSRGASLKGLMLRSNGGSLSIDPIQTGTDELTLESDVKDGCYIQTLSNGSEWFIWSVATGGTISVRTSGVIATYTPTPPTPVYADITNVVITSDVRFVGSGLEARHDLTFSGQGEPNATLTITEDGGAIIPIVITIPSDGNWTVTRSTDLPNATYTFDFNPTLGNGVQNQSFIGDTGPINFTVPSTFTPDPAEVVDFASGASAVKPDSTPIAVVVDSSAWNSSLVHGDTFDIIYSITDPAVNGGVTVSQTVTGTIVDDTPPAAPVISAASIANINELSANGTAEPNKTITLFQDSLPLSPTVTSDGAGNWSFGPVVLNFNSNFTLKAQASEDGVGNPNLSDFGEYSPAFNYVQPVTDTPTIGVDGEQTSVWTNTANSFTISGTTEIGATIDVLNGANPATLVSGPTVDGAGYWTATIDVAPESVTSLSAKATLAGHLTSQAASFQLNVDRVPPVITLTGGAQTVYLGNIGAVNDQGATATDFSSATVVSDWATAVDATEGAKTVTYTATDAAGNTATDSRTVTVTTEVVVPTNLVAVDNGDGTVTLTGDVAGVYADNLQVKINAIDSLGLEEVYQESSLDVLFEVNGGSFSVTMTLDADTYTFEAQTINSIGETSLFDDCVPSNSVEVAEPPAPVGEFYEDRLNSATIEDYTNPTNVLTQATYDDATGVLSVTRGGTPTAIINIDGSTDAFATNNDPSNDGDTTKKISVSTWVKCSAMGNNTNILLFTIKNSSSEVLFEMRLAKNDFWQGFIVASPYSIGTQGGNSQFTSIQGFDINADLLDDQWHHFMYYYDGASTGEQRIYIDGTLTATRAHGTGAFTIDRYLTSGFTQFEFNALNTVSYIGGDFDSLTFYQGFEMTEQIAGWIASDATRQRIYSDEVELPPVANFLEDSSSLVLDQSFVNNGWLEYTSSGTLSHKDTSALTNNPVASVPVSLFSSTNTPTNIIYSFWFNVVSTISGQVILLKGTSGNSHAYGNGPGIVWHAGGGNPYLREATSGITDGTGANHHSDGTDARLYYDVGSSLVEGSWHHVIVQHSWDGTNFRWISNVFINGARATTADGTSVSDVHIDNSANIQTILDNSNGLNYLVSTGGAEIDSYNVVIDSSETITEGIASAIYSDSTRQTGIAAALAMDTTAPVMTITNTDTGLELSDGDTVNLVDGDAFNFTAVTDDGSPVVIAQGGSPVSSGTTFTTGTYSVTFDSTDGVNAASTITITLEVVAAANFIEDIQSVINRAAGQTNISIVNGIVIDTYQNSPSHGLNVRLADDGIVAYDSLTGETVNDEFTISFWANLDSQGDNTYFMGTNSGRPLYFYLGGTTNATFRLGWSDGTSNFQHFALNAGTFTSWTHFVLTVEKTSTNIALSVYINGSKLSIGQSQTAPLGTKILPPLANQVIKFGGVEGITGQTKSVSGQFDSIQIGDGIALSADQILWISQDSLRQRSIAGAVAAINTAPTIELNGDSNLFHTLGQSFNDPGATAQDQADGDLTSSIQTTIVNSQGGSVSAIDATSPEDTYTITYSVTDSGGLSATVTRTVLVSAVITTSSLLTTQTVTLNGSTTLTNGILDLPGANGDYASIAGSSNYDPSGGITYSAWVYLDTLKNQQGILSNIFSTTSWDGISIQFQKNNTYPNGFVVVACNGPSGINKRIDDVPIDSSNNPVSITTGVWHFLAVTFNPTGGECIAYFNGVALNQTLSGAEIAHNNSWPFYIGAQRDSNNINYTVDGQIQGVRIEQTIKSASQLLATYNAGPQ